MKNLMAVITLGVFLLGSSIAWSASEHAQHGKDGMAHEEVVDGVKATFTVQTMAAAMKAMGQEMPKGVKETHHISIAFSDVKSGKSLTEGEVKVKLQNPDKSAQEKVMMGMHGHFGADFVMAKKGKYGVMSKFILKDGKVRSSKFWYEVK